MKKMISLLLALALVAAIAAGCAGGNNENDTTGTTGAGAGAQTSASALAVLNNLWALYSEEEKFPVAGGDTDKMNPEGPDSYGLEDTASLSVQLLVPEDQAGKIEEAAALFHGMMVNNFTCGVFRMATNIDAAAFAEMMHGAVANARWMCGMPEKLLIAVVDDRHVLVAFGLGDLIGGLQTKLTAAYPNAQIKYAEDIVG